jgi:outer membrane immunogenic protein
MHRLAKLAFVGACIAIGSGHSARAADYEGWYIGINIGGAWARPNSTQGLNQSAGGCGGGGGGGAGCVIQQNALDGIKADQSQGNVTGGFQAGYAWRYNFVVVGVEADINYFDFNNNETVTTSFFTGGSTKVITTATSVKSNYLATVRPRIGLVSTNNILFYITGGWAFSDQTFTNDTSVLNVGPGGIGTPPNFHAIYTTGTSSKTVGTVWGGGIEYAYMPGRTFKIEYQHISFDNPSATGANTVVTGGSLDGSFLVMNAKPTADIVRFGMNWRL